MIRGKDYLLVAPCNADIAKQSSRTSLRSLIWPSSVCLWRSLSEAIPHCALFTKVGLEWAETYYKRMECTHAYAVAMFVDPSGFRG
ncbi:hypothetical protein BS17DRAFT_162584 [Gyrodon lividus]|nr:hypothetical protein BS17DRAFT_162584 [Gyrodon lividus]